MKGAVLEGLLRRPLLTWTILLAILAFPAQCIAEPWLEGGFQKWRDTSTGVLHASASAWRGVNLTGLAERASLKEGGASGMCVCMSFSALNPHPVAHWQTFRNRARRRDISGRRH